MRLRLTNIDYFIEALKTGRVRRIFDEQNKGIWNDFYFEKKNRLWVGEGGLILESNLHVQDCYQMA